VIAFQSMCFAENFTGVTAASQDILLSLQMDGIVKQVMVKEGDHVVANTAILKLDEQLQKLERERRKLIWKDTSQLIALKNKLTLLKSMLDSSRELYTKNGAISEDELRGIEVQFSTTSGEYEMLLMAKKRERIEYDIANAVVNRHTLRAPITGIVTSIQVNVGEWVRTGKVVVRMVDTTNIHLEISVDDRHAGLLTVGQMLNVTVNPETSALQTLGEVEFISPVADKASGLIRITIALQDSSGVRPGMPASILLQEPSQTTPQKVQVN